MYVSSMYCVHFSFQIREIYGADNFFPIEARLHLSDWIEKAFTPLVTLRNNTGSIDGMEDASFVQQAATVGTQLMQQLDAKIQSTPNDPDKFLMKTKLQEISENLKV